MKINEQELSVQMDNMEWKALCNEISISFSNSAVKCHNVTSYMQKIHNINVIFSDQNTHVTFRFPTKEAFTLGLFALQVI